MPYGTLIPVYSLHNAAIKSLITSLEFLSQSKMYAQSKMRFEEISYLMTLRIYSLILVGVMKWVSFLARIFSRIQVYYLKVRKKSIFFMLRILPMKASCQIWMLVMVCLNTHLNSLKVFSLILLKFHFFNSVDTNTKISEKHVVFLASLPLRYFTKSLQILFT